MNYETKRKTALRLIQKFGTVATLTTQRYSDTQKQAWRAQRTADTIDGVGCVVFDDDGETFLNHNVTGNVRIVLLAPDERVTNIDIGDTIILPTKEVLTVDKVKSLNPDTSGAILWTLLAH